MSQVAAAINNKITEVTQGSTPILIQLVKAFLHTEAKMDRTGSSIRIQKKRKTIAIYNNKNRSQR
jgi:hypothetical protein